MAEYMPTIPAHGRQKQYVVQAGLHIQLKLQPLPPQKKYRQIRREILKNYSRNQMEKNILTEQ